MVVIVAWVHWRKVVGELKLNPWVAVIFLAIIFRPAIVELLRRTDKISTSWAELSLQRLEEAVEKADELSETNDPQPIEVAGKVTGDFRYRRLDIASDPIAVPDPSEVARNMATILDKLPEIPVISFAYPQAMRRPDELVRSAHKQMALATTAPSPLTLAWSRRRVRRWCG